MNDVKLTGTVLSLAQGSAASSSKGIVSPQKGEPESSVKQAENQAQLQALQKQSGEEQVERSDESVKEAVTRLNDYVQSVQRDLQFQLDDSSGKTIVTVLDSQTNEVVRQIPDDVALRLARELQQDEPLSLFNAKV